MANDLSVRSTQAMHSKKKSIEMFILTMVCNQWIAANDSAHNSNSPFTQLEPNRWRTQSTASGEYQIHYHIVLFENCVNFFRSWLKFTSFFAMTICMAFGRFSVAVVHSKRLNKREKKNMCETRMKNALLKWNKTPFSSCVTFGSMNAWPIHDSEQIANLYARNCRILTSIANKAEHQQ